MTSDMSLTDDAFLGGRLQILQPQKGYRAGVDPVLLAASVNAKAGQTLLDLGCGTGVAGLCLGARIPDVIVTGLERQQDYADLAQKNAQRNQSQMQVVCGDLTQMPEYLKDQQFDHVIANPPYYDPAKRSPATDPAREAAMGEITPLADWVKAAAKRTKPKGHVSFVHRASRLPDLLEAMQRHLGSLVLLPLSPRVGQPPTLVILRGQKHGHGDFTLCAPWILHQGDKHVSDGPSYTPETEAILRHGGPLSLDLVTKK